MALTEKIFHKDPYLMKYLSKLGKNSKYATLGHKHKGDEWK